jgi:CheY-like chemotaxis protein
MTNAILPRQSALVLIADDDEANRFLLRLLIEREGYNVVEAENGQDCLSIFEARQPDLVLLDAMMPVLDGFETCARLQKLPGGDRTPVLLTTVLADENSIKKAFKAGATEFITKPFNWPVLQQRIRRLIAARQTEQTRDDLLNIIIYSMNNPITTISAYSELLLENFDPEKQRREYQATSEILRCGQELADIAQLVQDIKRLEEGRAALDYKAVNLPEAIEQLAQQLETRFKSVQLQLQTAGNQPVLTLNMDWDLMRRVIQNLIAILLRTSLTQIIYLSTVYNVGQPFVNLKLEAQTEPNATVEQAIPHDHDVSYRLGLNFCKTVVEAHGGYLYAHPEATLGYVIKLPQELLTVPLTGDGG